MFTSLPLSYALVTLSPVSLHQLRSIGLITSRHSEALHDFEDTLRKEGSIASIRLIEARIQGKYAGSDIAHAINRFNRERNVDVIALIRGGGRVADLAIFNDYKIARAICTSTIPLVTGIGHQRDETVADQVADVREITPTAAAIRLARHSQPAQSAQTKPSGITPYLIGVIAVLLIAGLLLLLIARQ